MDQVDTDKHNPTHLRIVAISALLITLLALFLLFFILATPASKAEAGQGALLERQIGQFPKSYELKQAVRAE